jgi:hypothetical protein
MAGKLLACALALRQPFVA